MDSTLKARKKNAIGGISSYRTTLSSNTRFIVCSRYFYAKIYTNFVLRGKILFHRSV